MIITDLTSLYPNTFTLQTLFSTCDSICLCITVICFVNISGRNSWSEIIAPNIHWGILTETAKLLSTEAVLVYIQELYMRVPDSWHACQLWDEQKGCALQSAWRLREPCRKALLFPACVCCCDSSHSEERRSFSPYTFLYCHSRGPGSTFSEMELPNRSYGLERWLDARACLPLLQRTWVQFPTPWLTTACHSSYR